jgi:hypothetical protein
VASVGYGKSRGGLQKELGPDSALGDLASMRPDVPAILGVKPVAPLISLSSHSLLFRTLGVEGGYFANWRLVLPAAPWM